MLSIVNADRACSVGECGRPFYGKGFCKLHWHRWWRHGTIEKPVNRCKMDDCGRKVYGHGFCHMHYQRWKKTGDPLGMRGKSGMTAAERFWAKVDTSGGPDACWPWTGGHNDCGYGLVRSNGKPDRRAHRVAYELAVGPIPEGLDVLHQCDNPPCCNPKCLHTGTHDQNMAEMVQRKRRGRKFSDEVMIAVLESQEPHRVIAERYGMSRSYIALIKQQYVPGMHRSFTS